MPRLKDVLFVPAEGARSHSSAARLLLAFHNNQRSSPDASVMTKLFISHSSQDDAFVRDLRDGTRRPWTGRMDRFARTARLAICLSRKSKRPSRRRVCLCGRGQPGCVSIAVGWSKSSAHALEVQKHRGPSESFPLFPLLLDGTKLGSFERILRRGTVLNLA